MDYKEIHQEVYENLTEEFGREPDPEEMHQAYRDEILSRADWICDCEKYE